MMEQKEGLENETSSFYAPALKTLICLKEFYHIGLVNYLGILYKKIFV